MEDSRQPEIQLRYLAPTPKDLSTSSREAKPKTYSRANAKPSGVPPGNPPFTMISRSHECSFASILKEGPHKTLSPEHLIPALVLDDSCLKDHDFSLSLMGKVHWLRAKELDAWVPKFLSIEECDSSDDDESNDFNRDRKPTDMEFDNPIAESDVERVLESSFIRDNNLAQENDQNTNCLGHKAKKGWIKDSYSKHKVNFAAIQETKMESIDLFSIKVLWGNLSFDHVVSSAIGNSGGILCVWDLFMFIKEHGCSLDNFLAIMGSWSPTSTKLLIISIYASQELSIKRVLREYICILIDRWEGKTVILGNFNEKVRRTSLCVHRTSLVLVCYFAGSTLVSYQNHRT
uniref:RNA-directed DNA polymerase, eukaryota n=1 Tax=Tanacetum cinerariifolium TaxID=118510 RepID=A0A699HAC6_TANCI|nr:RNA-directed DNA polymerase, eukaryota [Tanacetum cinerariifolium]